VQSVTYAASKSVPSFHPSRDLMAVIVFSLVGLTISFALMAALGAEDLSAILTQLN
jgi:hypothetical protein